MFRAPFGTVDKPTRAWIQKRNLTEVFWSVDTRDWDAKDPETLRRQTLSMILEQEGGVVLMHDIKPITATVVNALLDDLEAENCRRLEQSRSAITPVSLHYFLRDNKQPREIPEDVKRRTEAYRTALPVRCAARKGRPPEPPLSPPPPPADVPWLAPWGAPPATDAPWVTPPPPMPSPPWSAPVPPATVTPTWGAPIATK
jgi:hypothetical protein